MKRTPAAYLKLTKVSFIVAVVSWFVLPVITNVLYMIYASSNGSDSIVRMIFSLKIPIRLILIILPLAGFLGYLVSLKRSATAIGEPDAKNAMTWAFIFWGLSLVALPALILLSLLGWAESGMCGANGGSCGFVPMLPVLMLIAALTLCLSIYSLVTVRSRYSSGDYGAMVDRAMLPFSGLIALLIAVIVMIVL
ncbi:MAG: hypothetical protein HGA31_06715 [Candidatus Moranbacteria bacterium]|nr:hypothetical protein [Candidatus Moranbacteria bacterium]